MSRSQLLDLLRQAPAYRESRAGYISQGVAEVEPFPFLGIVGQEEMKLSLVLAVINPAVGGVLLLGPRGTGKTTAVRSLVDLLPSRVISLCASGNGCTEAILEAGGMSAICKDCAQKAGYGEPLSREERVRIVNLPLNARLEDVVGGIDERLALEQQRLRLERGLLSQADGHILYIDEVNMLEDNIADAILDAAAQGYYSVRRGPQKLTYSSRFLLVGSMNPEEGNLRTQLMDRFGLRVLVRGLDDPAERFSAYEQATWYQRDPEGMAAAYAAHTLALAEEMVAAQARLPRVVLGEQARDLGLAVVRQSGIHSARAEITLFEAARAHAAAAERELAVADDVRAVALLALRLRRSPALDAFLQAQANEDEQLRTALAEPPS
jgi:magnesium chelatase subunit I